MHMCYNECDMKKIIQKNRIWILLILGFCAIEFPGILFIKNMAYPLIFKMPFIYGYAVCCWFYFCFVLFYAWRTKWGRKTFFKNMKQAK